MTIQFVGATIIICILYLFILFRNRNYRMLLPCTIHTITWLVTAVLIYLTIIGQVGEYMPSDPLQSYNYVAPFILGLVIASIIGFSMSHVVQSFIPPSDSFEDYFLDIDVDYVLKKFHWILYVCLALGVVQFVYLLMTVGYSNLLDYRMAAVTLERTGVGAFSQRFSGHVTILGTFYFALEGFKMGRAGMEMKRFLLDAFLLASTNLAIAGRGWIITVLIPFFITYFWQRNYLGEKLWAKDSKRLLMILVACLVVFSVFGIIRNDGDSINNSRIFDKFLYYTDGSRITNYVFSLFPDGSFNYEYGQSEFLYKWLGSPMLEKLNYIKSFDHGLSVTVSSSMPSLYFDYGWWGGIFMWGVFCFLIELGATKFRNKHTILGIFVFMEFTRLLFQCPIGEVFNMEIPVIEWLIILYIFRRKLFCQS